MVVTGLEMYSIMRDGDQFSQTSGFRAQGGHAQIMHCTFKSTN